MLLRFYVFAGLTLLTNTAFAQALLDITPPIVDTVTLLPGEIRVLQFGAAVNRVETPRENIVEVTPQSDRVFAFKGLNNGEAIVSVRFAEAGNVSRLRFLVGTHPVKVYGTRRRGDYLAYECDRQTCGTRIRPGQEPEGD